MAEGWQNLDVAPGDVPNQREPSHWSAYVLAGRRPSAATTWLRRAAGESGCSPLSRTTSAIDRRSEKAIAQSGLVLLGFDCRKKRHRLRKCLVSDPVPQRGTPALVGRSVFIANLLFTDDQVSRPDQQIPDRWSFCRNRFARVSLAAMAPARPRGRRCRVFHDQRQVQRELGQPSISTPIASEPIPHFASRSS